MTQTVSLQKDGRRHPCSEETRAKISAALMGKNNPMYGRTPWNKGLETGPLSEEHRGHISEALKGHSVSDETREKISVAQRGEKNHMYGRVRERNPFYGRKHTEKAKQKNAEAHRGKKLSAEHKAKISAAGKGKTRSKETRAKMCASWTPKRRAEKSAFMSGKNNPMKRPEVRAKNSGENSHTKRPEVRAKISASKMGENNPSFNNWASREPYCHLWNEPLRERYRNRYGRVCVLSDTLRSVMGPESGLDDFEGHEIFSKVRLSVHHIRGNKMSGCDGTELALIPLQGRFNATKFDGLKLEDHPFYITLFLFKDIERKHRSRQ